MTLEEIQSIRCCQCKAWKYTCPQGHQTMDDEFMCQRCIDRMDGKPGEIEGLRHENAQLMALIVERVTQDANHG